MNKYRKILIVLISAFLLVLIFSNIELRNSFAKNKFIKQPLDYKEILNRENPKLSYKYTITKDSSYPVSIYTYDNSKYGLILFKKKVGAQNLIDKINFINSQKYKEGNQVYSKFIFEKISYTFQKEKKVNQIDFFIDNYTSNYLIDKTEKSVYFSFPIKKSLTISSDNKGFFFQSGQTSDKKLGSSELMIHLKNEYIYFVYLRPLNRVRQEEKLILKKL